MATTREIIGIGRSRPTLEGAGVHLRRTFGFHDSELFYPFLLLDDFRGDDPAQYTPQASRCVSRSPGAVPLS